MNDPKTLWRRELELARADEEHAQKVYHQSLDSLKAADDEAERCRSVFVAAQARRINIEQARL